MKNKKYYDVAIQKHHAGFGMYQMGELGGGEGYEDKTDLLMEISRNGWSEIFELGKDNLPENLENISGRIYGERGTLYGYIDESDMPRYFSIVKK